MKNWLFILMMALTLAACNDATPAGPTIEKVENVTEDVQSLVDFTEDDKFASFIFSETNTNYLLLNATGEISVELESADEVLNIYITQTEGESSNVIEDIVYAIDLDKTYDTIHLFKNDEEIDFEVWYE